ncbi:MAG: GTPase [Mycoplasmoidaceae bacterium]
MNYNRKCIGCGNYLSSDKNSISYVSKFDDDFKYCVRCFKLKNYGENIKIETDENIKETLNKIDFEDNLIIMILDLFDIKNSILSEFELNSNVLVVVNKRKCLPKKFQEKLTVQNIYDLLNEKGIYPIDIILYDAFEKTNLWKIIRYIEEASKEKHKAYFIGKTNVGKSSLINALLSISKIDAKLVTSPIKNTTLNLIKIKMNKCQLIDTPGYPNEKSVFNFLDSKDILKTFKSEFSATQFHIKKNNQIFFIENLFCISIDEIGEENSSLVFYKSSFLKVNKVNKDKIKNYIQKNEHIRYTNEFQFIENKIKLDPKKKYSIFASGASLIVLKGVESITIFSPKEIGYSITEKSII